MALLGRENVLEPCSMPAIDACESTLTAYSADVSMLASAYSPHNFAVSVARRRASLVV